MRIRIDRTKCIGAASCVALVPAVFALDHENKAVMKQSVGEPTSEWVTIDVLDASFDELLAAAESCPTLAIFIEDDDGNQLYP